MASVRLTREFVSSTIYLEVTLNAGLTIIQ